MVRDITRRDRGSELARLEWTDLLVQGADLAPLRVIQCGPVHGSRQVVEREFVLAARVDDGVEGVELAQHLACIDWLKTHGNNFFRTGQTLASMMGWACSTG